MSCIKRFNKKACSPKGAPIVPLVSLLRNCPFDDLLEFITFLDEEHSIDEERYITIGFSNKNRLLLVAHAEQKDTIRIISARKATKNEEKFYQEAR